MHNWLVKLCADQPRQEENVAQQLEQLTINEIREAEQPHPTAALDALQEKIADATQMGRELAQEQGSVPAEAAEQAVLEQNELTQAVADMSDDDAIKMAFILENGGSLGDYLEKEAFVGKLLSGVAKKVMTSGAGSKVMSKAMKNPNAALAIGGGVANKATGGDFATGAMAGYGAGRFGGGKMLQSGLKKTMTKFAGVPLINVGKMALRGAGNTALVGGGIGAVGGAIRGGEGNRLRGAAGGAAKGALIGGAVGAAGGAGIAKAMNRSKHPGILSARQAMSKNAMSPATQSILRTIGSSVGKGGTKVTRSGTSKAMRSAGLLKTPPPIPADAAARRLSSASIQGRAPGSKFVLGKTAEEIKEAYSRAFISAQVRRAATRASQAGKKTVVKKPTVMSKKASSVVLPF